MRKIIVILIAILILSVCASITSANNYNIYSTLAVNGTGNFDRTLDVQTEAGFYGKSLNEDYYTKWIGSRPESEWNYKSGLVVFMGNDGGNKRGETIDYAQTTFSTNADWSVSSTNYDTGAMQKVSSRGNMIESLEISVDDHMSKFNFEGAVIGRMRIIEKAVDPVSQLTYLHSDTRLYGEYEVGVNSIIIGSRYSQTEKDWLGCP